MINSVAEIRAVRQVLEDLRRTINVPAPPLGIMIETHGSGARRYAAREGADFFSIGTKRSHPIHAKR